MLYKTIVLELIQQHPDWHERLRAQRLMLPTLERLAPELKVGHDAWKEELSRTRPGSDPIQIASEALEIALKELEDCLPSESPVDEDEPPSTVAVEANRHRTSPD